MFRRVVPQSNEALIVMRGGRWSVSFAPVLLVGPAQRAERMDLGPRTVTVERSGSAALRCEDWSPIDVCARLSLRVARDPERILRVAQTLGAGAGDAAVSAWLGPAVAATLGALAAEVSPDAIRRQPEALAERALIALREDMPCFELETLALELPSPSAPRSAGPFR